MAVASLSSATRWRFSVDKIIGTRKRKADHISTVKHFIDVDQTAYWAMLPDSPDTAIEFILRHPFFTIKY